MCQWYMELVMFMNGCINEWNEITYYWFSCVGNWITVLIYVYGSVLAIDSNNFD